MKKSELEEAYRELQYRYNKLHSDFNDGINAIIKSMNDSLSKEQKEAQKNR